MQEVVRIAPVQTDPGLIAYECPSCGYVTSDLMPSNPQPPGKQQTVISCCEVPEQTGSRHDGNRP
jgi:hypothetical protein